MRRVLVILIICWFSLFLFAVFSYTNKEQKFKLIFLDIGQGDSALIKFKDSSKMLVDCGANKKVLAKLGKYLPFYDRTIDYLLISHYDLDHYGGCIDILKRYRVKNIIHNGRNKDDEYYQEWDKYKKNEKANEIIINQQVKMNIANSTLIFLWPTEEGDNENNNSVVFKLINASTTILFTGDIEEKVEKKLIDQYCDDNNKHCGILESEILKVSHHGSGGSSSENFLQAVNAKKAIISVGKNSFGHPSLRVLEKLKRSFVEIFRTDEQKDIIFSSG